MKRIGLFGTLLLFVVSLLAVAPSNASAGAVPDTGVTKCYDDAGNVITCPSPGQRFYGQDANYTINPPSYTKLDANGNDLSDSATSWAMVRDNVTGLIWEVKTNQDGTPNYSDPHDADNTYTWYDPSDPLHVGTASDHDTKDFLDALNTSRFGGYSDWRLPTIKELLAYLVRYDIPYFDVAIDIGYFPNALASCYWSSTTLVGLPSYAWIVYFGSGNDSGYGSKGHGYYVRAVRGGQSGSSAHSVIGSFGLMEDGFPAEAATDTYTDNGDGTVTDTSTGLMWQQETPDNTKNWEQALSYCENLTLGGHTDWRLPTIKELLSLVDYSHRHPAINTAFFPGTVASYYWSSTTDAGYPYDAWVVNFDSGYVYSSYKSSRGYVRAVRGGGGLGDSLVIVGDQPGWSNVSVSADKKVQLKINSTNSRGDKPVYEWLLGLFIIDGVSLPGFIISDRGIYALSDVLASLSEYTFSFDPSGVTKLATLSMAELGLKSGDAFLYGYAYQNQNGIVYIDNVVSINVQ
ncbi:DUF1566 domain-containing protein [Desulfatirhabdium butyrativorans]|uniref:Lcl C-terminal domain-containing protein n=1 Tax=Desulfatirhabdium butyrativorans TaxID=340467 RepID=UPI000415030C|nr:DUF1566 domain-containing protein [Desulfatirhabdium butyrativorans]